MKLIPILFIFSLCTPIFGKVLIITHAFNRPDFIEFQYRTFHKFIQDDYEYVVFNDAHPGPIHDEIVAVCQRWNIPCIRIPQEIHNQLLDPRICLATPSRRHADGIQFSLDLLGFDHDGVVALVDSDLFLIRPFSFEEVLKNHDIAAVIRVLASKQHVRYLWPGLTILAMNRLPEKKTLNFYGYIIEGYTDTGGATYHYLRQNPSVRARELDTLSAFQFFCPDQIGHMDFGLGVVNPIDYTLPLTEWALQEQFQALKTMGFTDKEIHFLLKKPDTVQFVHGNHFIHYQRASGYDGRCSREYDSIKTELFREFFEDILAD